MREKQSELTKLIKLTHKQGYSQALKDIKTARQCMNYQKIKCSNKSCLNLSCPLNKSYDKIK